MRRLALALFLSLQVYLTSCSKQTVCLRSTRRSPLKLQCPRNQVIMRPKVMVGKMAADVDPDGDCQYNSEEDCFGTTPEVIAQSNECHFHQTCSIKLNRNMPITSSSDRSCLATRPDYAVLFSYECVCRKSLQFLCQSRAGEQTIKRKEGVLVSHDAYPWHYQRYPECIACFPYKANHRLTLWTDDIDTDPEGRDVLAMYNITFEGDQKLFGDPLVNSRDGFNLTIPSSTVEIKFTIGEYSKSGRGFVIKYKWIPAEGKEEGPNTKKASCPKPSKEKKKKKKNNKKKKNKKRRHKGSSKPQVTEATPGDKKGGSGKQATSKPRRRGSRRNGARRRGRNHRKNHS